MRPGDYALSITWNFVGAAIRVATRARYNHVRLITSDDGACLESLGQGATFGRVRDGDVIVSPPLTDDQRELIPGIALMLEGTTYDYLDVAALGLAQIGVEWPAVRAKLDDPDGMFCSQLVDQALLYAGFHMFDDGRLPQNVSPGDLADQALRMGWPSHVHHPPKGTP